MKVELDIKTLQMEMVFQESATILKGDELYLDFHDHDGQPCVIVCITRPDGSQQVPKATVAHAPTMKELYG